MEGSIQCSLQNRNRGVGDEQGGGLFLLGGLKFLVEVYYGWKVQSSWAEMIRLLLKMDDRI
jgi:hypothetical protein